MVAAAGHAAVADRGAPRGRAHAAGLEDGDDGRRFELGDTIDLLVDLLDGHDPTDVTLVGRSRGDYPVCGAAHRTPHRPRHLVFYSAFVPENDVPLVKDVPVGHAALFRQRASESPDNTAVLPCPVRQSAFVQETPDPRES